MSVDLALRVATGDPQSPVWTNVADAPVRVDGTWSVAGRDAIRKVQVTNMTSSPVQLVGLEWADRHAAVGSTRLLHAGYQSWSYVGIEAVPDSLSDHLGTAPHGGDNENTLNEVPGVSWWYGVLTDSSGSGLLAAADSATVLKTYIDVDGTRMRIVQGVTGDALTVAPGETVVLDSISLSFGQVEESLERYAARVAALHPRPVGHGRPLGGWGSWNIYYDRPTAVDLRQELEWAHDHLTPVGMTDFLVDDGYESHWGSWTAKDTFGADHRSLNAEQVAASLKPAVWVAPFYLDTNDTVVSTHPDWFVHQRHGTLRTFSNLGSSVYAALDVSVPEARTFVVSQLLEMQRWGYTTFKLDFLFGAAIEGIRREPMTGLQSYARWMKVLRDALPDAHLVGCGAPLLPTVGWVDSMRTGADIAFTIAPEPRFSLITSEARSTALRAFTDAWWAVDPDVVLLRGSRLSDEEAWTATLVAALAGGNYLVGDTRQAGDLRASMALDPNVVALTRDGIAARPTDMMNEIEPAIAPSPLLLRTSETAIPHLWKKTAANGQMGKCGLRYSVGEVIPASRLHVIFP